jgi:predicted nuclease with TOPRIM domain
MFTDPEGEQQSKSAAKQRERAARNQALTRERRRKARLEEVEARVADLDAQLGRISEVLAAPPDDPGEVLRLGDDYVEIQNELEALIAEWETLQT